MNTEVEWNFYIFKKNIIKSKGIKMKTNRMNRAINKIFWTLVCLVGFIIFILVAFPQSNTSSELYFENELPSMTNRDREQPLTTREIAQVLNQPETPIAQPTGQFDFNLELYNLSIDENEVKFTPKSPFIFTFDGIDITIKIVSAPQ